MIRQEQYEIWVQKESKWEMLACFKDFGTAEAMTRHRSNRMRMIQITYENGKMISQESIAEIGTPRGAPQYDSWRMAEAV